MNEADRPSEEGRNGQERPRLRLWATVVAAAALASFLVGLAVYGTSARKASQGPPRSPASQATEVPRSALAKLQGDAAPMLSRDRVSFRLRNGSDWLLYALTVEITVHDPDGAVAGRRNFRLSRYSAAMRAGEYRNIESTPVRPEQTVRFVATLQFPLRERQTLSARIVSAKGRKARR